MFWSGQKQNIRVDIHADDYRRILTEGAAISHSHFTRRIRFVLIKTNWTMLCSSGEKVWFVATELSLLVAPAFIQTLNPISRLVPMSSFISTACRNVSFAAILFPKQKKHVSYSAADAFSDHAIFVLPPSFPSSKHILLALQTNVGSESSPKSPITVQQLHINRNLKNVTLVYFLTPGTYSMPSISSSSCYKYPLAR